MTDEPLAPGLYLVATPIGNLEDITPVSYTHLYRQSERLGIYREHTDRLLADGKAYRCFCTAEELEAERRETAVAHQPQVYSGRCRNIAGADSAARAAKGDPFAVRLRIPDHPLRFHDMVRGVVEFPNETVSDPILVRSNGMPVYNYVVTVDDACLLYTSRCV